MAANSYYNTHIPSGQEQQQHLISHCPPPSDLSSQHYIPAEHEQHQHLLAHAAPPSNQSSQPSTPLKPLHLVEQTTHNQSQDSFEKLGDLHLAKREDARLKARIRRFRVVSRVLSFLISIGVLALITMTLTKFLQTKNTYRDVVQSDGTLVSRTAWAHDSTVWPTYSYFAVALLSALLNFSTIFSYKFGVGRANTASYVASGFAWAVMIGNLVVWAVAAAVYRSEKNKGGKSNDLWGWTCSAAARAIQGEFEDDVDFNTYCNVQSASWFVGLAQVGASALTVFIYVMVIRRKASKKKVQALSKMGVAR